MAVKVTGQFEPAGSFPIVDGADVSGHITGSNISASGFISTQTSVTASIVSASSTVTGISGSFIHLDIFGFHMGILITPILYVYRELKGKKYYYQIWEQDVLWHHQSQEKM